MKKKSIVLFLTLSLMCFTLAACRKSASQSLSTENNSTGEGTIVLSTTMVVGTTIVVDSNSVEETADSEETELQEESSMNSDLRTLSDNTIAIHISNKVYTVNMYDNPTANDLVSQLPITLTVNDYAGWDEKIVRLNTPLSMEGASNGDNPAIPDLGYYEPGQWLAIYYGYIGYWSGKVPLGQINASVDELRSIPDNATVTIEIVQK